MSTTEIATTTTLTTPDTRPEKIQKIDVSLDPTKVEERERKVNASVQEYEDTFGSLDMDKSYDSLFELLWYSQMPCFDVEGLTSKAKDEMSFLKRCYWKDKRINCSSIFNQRPTDRGMCCSFNMPMAQEIFKKSKYTEAISARQHQDAKEAFESHVLPKWYTKQNEPKPSSGRHKGLMLVVDGHSNKQSSATVKENFRGFFTLVDDRQKFPLASLATLITRPGFENYVNVGAINLEAKKGIRKYEPERRNCYFPDEYNLQMHRNYSQFNCLFECKSEFASKCISTCSEPNQVCKCEDLRAVNRSNSCVPWFYPIKIGSHYKMCNPWNTEKFLGIINEQIPEDECNYCLPDCEQTKYVTSMTYAKLRKCDRTNLGGPSVLCSLADDPLNPAPWINTAQKEFVGANQTLPWYLETDQSKKDTGDLKFPNQRLKVADESKKSSLMFPSQLEENPTYDAFEKDIGILNIFFGEEKISKYVTENRMSEYGFFSQIGGSLGFMMGVSIISMIEIIYWFILRLFQKLVCYT